MPIVDDPFDFGDRRHERHQRHLRDGGDPVLAIANLGWPVNVLAPEVAREVVAADGPPATMRGIPWQEAISIDAPEPISALAVTGIVEGAHTSSATTPARSAVGCT